MFLIYELARDVKIKTRQRRKEQISKILNWVGQERSNRLQKKEIQPKQEHIGKDYEH